MLNDLIRLTRFLGRNPPGGEPSANRPVATAELEAELRDLRDGQAQLTRCIERLEICDSEDTEALVTLLVEVHLQLNDLCSTLTDLHGEVVETIRKLPQIEE